MRRFKKKAYKGKKKYPIRRFNNKVHSFTRHGTSASTISCVAGATSTGAFYFALDSLPNYTEFTSLYDQYRICAVKLTISNRYNTLSGFDSTNNYALSMPILYTAIDLDDDVAPTLSSIKEHSNCKTRYFSSNRRAFSTYLKPRFLNNVYRNTISPDGFTLGNRKAWLDMAYADIRHYGVKFVIDIPDTGTNPSPPTFVFDVDIKYYIQCRQPR